MSNRNLTVEKIAERFGTSKRVADNYLVELVAVLKEQLEETGEVLLPGFGRMKVVLRPPRKGHNPRTGVEIDIPSKKVIKFKQF